MPSTSSSWPEANDYRFMKQALRLASRAKGLTSPNPTVGAVIAYKGQVVAQGYHRGAGQPHAEIVAIQNAHRAGYRNLSRCTLYVTLEPCSTFGRTPPCTDAILQEKFQRVVIAALDPNPQHSGRALSLLKQGGIQVEHGLLAEEANLLNRDFNFYIVNRMPWVVAKYAMSLDGRLVPGHDQSRWLTSEKARELVQHFRSHADAILIGAGTLRADDPRLTLRKIPSTHRSKRPLIPIILTHSGNLPKDAWLLRPEQEPRPIIYQGQSWTEILCDLGKREVMHLIIEGGPKTLASAFEAGIVNEIHCYLAPKILGSDGTIPPWTFREVGLNDFTPRLYRRVGSDFFSLSIRSSLC